MTNDPFKTWKIIQDEMLALSGRQAERARSAMTSPTDPAPLQQATQDAVTTSARVWQHWVDLWTPKP